MNKLEQIYRDLQKHMDRMPVGYPATSSGVDIRILKQFFTPEEAEVHSVRVAKPALSTVNWRPRL
jgi:Na+-translocating ferredoxin:NAD+ oxidoreductase subunit B